MTIRDDTTEWSRLGLLDSYIKRDRIKVAVSRHGENLTDCFSTFQVRAYSVPSLAGPSRTNFVIKIRMMIAANNVTDRAHTSTIPGPVVSMARQGDGEGPVEASEDTAVCNLCYRVAFFDNDNPSL